MQTVEPGLRASNQEALPLASPLRRRDARSLASAGVALAGAWQGITIFLIVKS